MKWTRDALVTIIDSKKTDSEKLEDEKNKHSGSASAELFKRLIRDPILGLQMDYCELIQPPANDYYFRLIRDRGYIFVSYTVNDLGSRHAGVVYGADDHGLLNLMNPSNTGLLDVKSTIELRGPIFVAYREYNMINGLGRS